MQREVGGGAVWSHLKIQQAAARPAKVCFLVMEWCLKQEAVSWKTTIDSQNNPPPTPQIQVNEQS